MAECRRLVPFNEEVSGPGESVADWDPEKSPEIMPGGNRAYENGESQNGPAGVQKSIAWTGMLLKIEGEKLVVS